MRKVLLSGALAVVGLVAPLVSVVATSAPQPAAAATPHFRPGLYHTPLIGKLVTVVPGLIGGSKNANAVTSANWAGYADNNDTFNSVAANWAEPTVDCSNSGGGGGLLGLGSLLGGPGAASSFWVGLDGYTSSSVEQLGTDSDCSGGSPSYYAWYEMYPNPSVPLSQTVKPGDNMTAWVASNAAGTSFMLSIKDVTQGWNFSITESGGPFARSSAEVVAEAPSECTLVFCSEVPLADFNYVDFWGANVMDAAGRQGGLNAFNANQINMASNGTTMATTGPLSPDGSAFSVTWNNS
jgi:hypothetical protein